MHFFAFQQWAKPMHSFFISARNQSLHEMMLKGVGHSRNSSEGGINFIVEVKALGTVLNNPGN